jgi:hypothetical protein
MGDLTCEASRVSTLSATLQVDSNLLSAFKQGDFDGLADLSCPSLAQQTPFPKGTSDGSSLPPVNPNADKYPPVTSNYSSVHPRPSIFLSFDGLHQFGAFPVTQQDSIARSSC